MKRGESKLDEGESRSAVALTVVWMLTCMSTAAAMLVVVAFRLLILAFPVAAGLPHPFTRIASVLLFTAVVTGLLCLALTPLANTLRLRKPPRAITAGAILIGTSPMLLLAVLSVWPG